MQQAPAATQAQSRRFAQPARLPHRKRVGHGFLVATGDGRACPVEMELGSAGLELPKALRNALGQRKLRSHIYPKVEQAVASVLMFGRFRINQSTLAEHFGVSRTVAHEILNGLEGVGLARHESNGRWHAGPLTYEKIEEFYEMRWVLEPVALRQAAPSSQGRGTALASREPRKRPSARTIRAG